MMPPSIFSDLDLLAALRVSSGSDKGVLVTTTFANDSSKFSHQVAWIDPVSVKWLEERFLLLLVDLRRDPASAVQLGIPVHARRVPHAIVFRDGEKIDCAVGRLRGDQIIEWIEGLSRGVRWIDSKRARALARPADVDVRLEYAEALVRIGSLDEAMSQYLELWRHTRAHDRGRITSVIPGLSEVAKLTDSARGTIAALRDDLQTSVDDIKDVDTVHDWILLNSILGDSDASIRWFDEHHRNIDASTIPWRPVVGGEIIPLLIARNRWADAGRLICEPRGRVKRLGERARGVDKILGGDPPSKVMERIIAGNSADWSSQVQTELLRQLRELAGNLVRMLRAAGRMDDATAVIEEARAADDSPEMEQAIAE